MARGIECAFYGTLGKDVELRTSRECSSWRKWQDKGGFGRHGLSADAWKRERVGSSALGRNRPKRQPGEELHALAFAGPAPRARTASYELDDELPFAP